MIKELEEVLGLAKVVARKDKARALALLKDLSDRVIEVAAPDWKPEEESLAEYAAIRRYPDFFHEMADRIEGSWRFFKVAGEDDIISAFSAAAFLLEVLRRLETWRQEHGVSNNARGTL